MEGLAIELEQDQGKILHSVLSYKQRMDELMEQALEELKEELEKPT